MLNAGVFLLEQSGFVSATITKPLYLSETVSVFSIIFPIKLGRGALFSENNCSLEFN